jgi:hypothetical protein
LRSGEPRRCPPLIPRASSSLIEGFFAETGPPLQTQLDHASQDDSFLDVESWADREMDNEYTFSPMSFAYSVDHLQPLASISTGFGGTEPLVLFPGLGNYCAPGFQSVFQTLSVTPRSSIRAISQSVLSEEPDSLIKEPDFKIIYKFLIKDKGQNLIK